MSMSRMTRSFASLLLLALLIVACDSTSSMEMEEEEVMDFQVEVQNVNVPTPMLKSGTFSSPGAGDLGPDVPALFPGESASFTFTAPPSTLPPLGGSGMHLNVATMFVQSNDLFYTFSPEGLDLFDENGNPVSGDVTSQPVLYDAGTEVDEEPGVGPTQKPRQGPTAVDVGPDEDEVLNLIDNAPTNDFTYPPTDQVIRVTVTPVQQ